MWWLPIALGAELAGTLTGADGDPVVGASVYVYDSRFSYGQATTRNGGTWSVRGLPADRYRIRYVLPDGEPHGDRFHGGEWDACSAESVLLPDEDSVIEGLDQSLWLGAVVAGRVTDLAGVGQADVRVAVVGAEPRSALVLRETSTDADGSFLVEGLDADEAGSAFHVYFEAPERPNQWLGGAYDADESESILLAPGDPSTLADAPLLDGIRVSGLISGPDGPVSSGTVIAYSTGQVLTEGVDEGGRYEAIGLPPGELVVWASSPGLATTYYPDADRPSGSLSVPAEGGEASVDLELPAEGVLTLEADVGAAAEGVGVVVYNDSYTVGRGAAFGPAGTLSVGGLHGGVYTIYVGGEEEGFVSGFLLDDAGAREGFAVVQAETTNHTLRLAAGATLSGTLRDDEGAPVYGATLVATETLGAERSWSTTSARDGTWTLPGLDATTVTLEARFHWYCPDDAGYAPTWYAAARSEADGELLLVAAGEAHGELDLVMPRDGDHDGMGDRWEEAHGLDPTRDDGAEDADGDGFSNLDEWLRDTDPTGDDGKGSCEGGCAGAPVALALAPLAWLYRFRRKVI